MEQPCRDRHSNVRDDLSVAKHHLGDRATSPAVAIGEWVDGLELRVGDGDLGQHGEISSPHERDQVIRRSDHAIVVRGNEVSEMRTEGAAADLYLLVAPAASELWCERQYARWQRSCPRSPGRWIR